MRMTAGRHSRPYLASSFGRSKLTGFLRSPSHAVLLQSQSLFKPPVAAQHGQSLTLTVRATLRRYAVMCLSEHGRTPKFYAASAGAPGRDHWSRAYSQLFAGAGVPRGQVLGASDATADDVIDRPIDPKDILCAVCHLMGVDPRTELLASPGRPVPLVAGGQIV